MPLYEIDGLSPKVPANSWVAPSADLIGDVRLGEEVGIWFGAVIRADNTPIVLGDRTNIQEGAMLHSDPGVPLTIARPRRQRARPRRDRRNPEFGSGLCRPAATLRAQFEARGWERLSRTHKNA
jgi:hypothetical protein